MQSRPKHRQRHRLAQFRRRGTAPPMLHCISNVRARLFFHYVVAPCVERETWNVLGFAPWIFPMREATSSSWEIPREKWMNFFFSRVQVSFPKSSFFAFFAFVNLILSGEGPSLIFWIFAPKIQILTLKIAPKLQKLTFWIWSKFN